MKNDNKILVKVRDLKKYFPIEGVLINKGDQSIRAVDGLNFDIYKGECLGLVGESGCGKTTTGKMIIRLIEPTEGELYFNDINTGKLNGAELKKLRKDIQIIFQDPLSSLNPRKTVGQIIESGLQIHKIGNTLSRQNKVLELLDTVGLLPEYINKFPHEFSGGQMQRIGIARALALNPKFIICDEPVSALDLSIQAQILNLLKELQDRFNLTYLFIAHNLSVVKHISSRVAVMYLGKIVEIADSKSLYENPIHPYTQALFSAIPIPDPIKTRKRKQIILKGDIPSPKNPPTGCNFNTRCPYSKKICKELEPEMLNHGNKNASEHLVACHYSKDFL